MGFLSEDFTVAVLQDCTAICIQVIELVPCKYLDGSTILYTTPAVEAALGIPVARKYSSPKPGGNKYPKQAHN